MKKKETVVFVKVTNIGERAGKEVVQVYYSAPQGLLGKPARELAAFQKTRLLGRGESQMLRLTIPYSRMASYDDCGKICKSAYVLEKKDATVSMWGNCVAQVQEAGIWNLSEDRIVEQLSPKAGPCSLRKKASVRWKLRGTSALQSAGRRTWIAAPGSNDFGGITRSPDMWNGAAHPGKKKISLADVAEGKPGSRNFWHRCRGKK